MGHVLRRAVCSPGTFSGKAGFISVGGARFTCKEKCGSGVLPNEIQRGESGGRNGSGSRSLESGARLLIALRLQPLHAGAGVALVAAHALQAPSFVRVARAAAAAPVEVCGQRVRALHVHVYLFCEHKRRCYRTATRPPPSAARPPVWFPSPLSESERSEDTVDPMLSIRSLSTPIFSSCLFRCRCSRCSLSIWWRAFLSLSSSFCRGGETRERYFLHPSQPTALIFSIPMTPNLSDSLGTPRFGHTVQQQPLFPGTACSACSMPFQAPVTRVYCHTGDFFPRTARLGPVKACPYPA